MSDGKKSPYDYDVPAKSSSSPPSAGRSNAGTSSAASGIFHVRSAANSPPEAKRMEGLGVSTDSTDHEASTVDLPTISVSEDELHDTISDISIDEVCEELQELDAADESTIGGGPSSMTGSCDEIRQKEKASTKSGSTVKKVSSNPSISTGGGAYSAYSIRSKVKGLGGKVKGVGGKVKGMLSGLHRSKSCASADVSKIMSSATPGDHPETVTIEIKQLDEIRKKELELKQKEEELKKLESTRKKEQEAKKKEEEKQRKAEEKRIKLEMEKISAREQELQRKERENEEKLAKKEQEVMRKEREIEAREALLEKRMMDFERRCRDLENERAKIADQQDMIRRERISLSGERSPVRDSPTTLRPSKSENQLNGDNSNEPLRPPRKKESRENLSNWHESRRRLPPPPRPPLPIPTSKSQSPTPQQSDTVRRSPLLRPQQFISSTDQSIRSMTSSSTQAMKTAPTSQPNTLFRISPTSSSSTLYCSDFVDIPLDDDATLRADIQRSKFNAKTFYRMIVLQWRARHPRRVLKDDRIRNNRNNKQNLYANTGFYSDTRIYSRPVTPLEGGMIKAPPRGHYTQPEEVIYAVPHKLRPQNPDDELRSYNYRIRRRRDFFTPSHLQEENPYDEIIYPIPIRMETSPVRPPRTRRTARTDLAIDDSGPETSRESSMPLTENLATSQETVEVHEAPAAES